MPLIEWTQDLSVNIDTIDAQHQKLVDMINNFYDQVSNKSNKELIGSLITQMREYTEIHFKTEEELYERYQYKNIKQHIIKHNDFVAKVNDLEKRYNQGKLIITFEITNFLKDWLINHIHKSDKEDITNMLKQASN